MHDVIVTEATFRVSKIRLLKNSELTTNFCSQTNAEVNNYFLC